MAAKKVKSVEVAKRIRMDRVRRLVRLGFAALFVGGVAGVLLGARVYAERTVLTPANPPHVEIVNAPAWMNPQLRSRIEQVATPPEPRSSLDGQTMQNVAASLAAEPWVKKVNQVRREYRDAPGDTLAIDCEFRAPVALVQDGNWFWMVDADGVKLPERFAKSELSQVALGQGLQGIQLRIVIGVRANAPEAGEGWKGDDLKAALDLARLFHGKPYMDDVAMIDVSSVEPPSLDETRRRNEIVLHTKYNTQVVWGESIPQGNAFSSDVPVDQKMMVLESLYNRFRRLDAGQRWVNIRYDRVLYPTDGAVQSATTTTP